MADRGHWVLRRTYPLTPESGPVPACPECNVLPDLVYLHDPLWVSIWWHRIVSRCRAVGPMWQWAPCGHTQLLADRPDLLEDAP